MERLEMRINEPGRRVDDGLTAERRSIRLVGDDPLLVRAIERLLRNAGYSVGTSGESPNRSRSCAQSTGPDVALTIVDLPDDRSEQARPDERDSWQVDGDVSRVLWLSSSPVPPARESSCLAKPFSASQLLARVESLVPA